MILRPPRSYGMPFTDENMLLLENGQKTQTRREVKSKKVPGGFGELPHVKVYVPSDILLHDSRRKKPRKISAGVHGAFVWSGMPRLSSDDRLMSHKLLPEQYQLITRYGMVGDELYTRETYRIVDFRVAPAGHHEFLIKYRADGKQQWCNPGNDKKGAQSAWKWLHDHMDTDHWRPPMFQYQWAARLRFEITGLKVECLNQISHEDAMAEGLIEVVDQPGQSFGSCFGTSPDKLTNRTSLGAYARIWEGIHGKGTFEDQPVYAYTLKKKEVNV